MMPTVVSRLLLCFLLQLPVLVTVDAAEVKVSYKSYSSPLDGIPVALGDFDANSFVDIFVLDPLARNLSVYLLSKDANPAPKVLLQMDQKIVGIIPADFDGDSRLDIAVTVEESGGLYSLYMTYGVVGRGSLTKPKLVQKGIKDQPTLLDLNADMVSDLMMDKDTGGTVVFYGKSLEIKPFVLSEASRIPNSNVFADFTGDLRADILVLSKDTSSFATIFSRDLDEKFTAKKIVIPMPSGMSDYMFGQVSTADLDNDSRLDIIVPVCSDKSCSKSLLMIYFTSDPDGKWVNAPVKEFQDGSFSWIPSDENPLKDIVNYPLKARPGDIDLDGVIDFLVTLKSKSGAISSASLSFTGGKNYELSVQRLVACPDSYVAGVSAIGDLNHDGALDLIIGCKHSSDKRLVTSLYTQNVNQEGYFFKVNVLSGKCSSTSDCPDGLLPVGLPVPGVCVKFYTEKQFGGYRFGVDSQASQSSYNSLQLPILHFGLGQFSNYIDSLRVAISYNSTSQKLEKEFPFIIPNSQLVVIPYPNDSPSQWRSELFVKPFYDKQILYVGITLLSTCFLVSVIAAIFQCVEYRQDKKERIRGQQGVVFDPIVGH